MTDMQVQAIIIDDEPLAVAELQRMLEPYPQVEVIATATRSADALQKIKQLNPDVIFLDINMPEMNGFQLLEALDETPEVIFITAYDEFAVKAFEVNALDYLLKPVNAERLAEAIKKLTLPQLDNKPRLEADKKIFIKDGEQCFFIPLKEIMYLESAGNYVKVFFKDKRPMLHRSLNYMEERLPDSIFFRASRQFIINTDFIRSIDPFLNGTLRVTMTNGVLVDISQRQAVKFKDQMGI
jgi:two-component system LytT family response regulator